MGPVVEVVEDFSSFSLDLGMRTVSYVCMYTFVFLEPCNITCTTFVVAILSRRMRGTL